MKLRLTSKAGNRASRPKIHGVLGREWRDLVPARPRRPRKLVNGRSVMVRNAASANNARSRSITVRHAGDSRVLKLGKFDLRSTAGRVYRQRMGELIQHLGGPDSVTTPMHTLCDQAARIHVLRTIAWTELSKTGLFHRGDARPALAVYQRLAADERDVLRTLGLQRVAREIPRLADVIGGRTR